MRQDDSFMHLSESAKYKGAKANPPIKRLTGCSSGRQRATHVVAA